MKRNTIKSRITPSAKRNTYSVAILFCIHTQGWEIATPTELPEVRTIPRRAPLNA
ncbi:hypothetical protein [Prevotella sp. P4-67]|uniref:hypothetical protein n=1 Tax=Prevotella sp. P4-67 TaxID=2024227 RepID=UPI0013034A59|nr:hypothetical protein [Prevotella sp. P4-67]